MVGRWAGVVMSYVKLLRASTDYHSFFFVCGNIGESGC